jgi:hypothetical protein
METIRKGNRVRGRTTFSGEIPSNHKVQSGDACLHEKIFQIF